MTGHSLVPMSARAAGISYEDLCVGMLATASLDTPPGACQGAIHAMTAACPHRWTSSS
jgi:D-alanine-D-alanine ligase